MSVYMSLVQSMSSVDRHCRGTGGEATVSDRKSKFLRFGVTMEMMTHCEEQCGDGSAALKVDHGQEPGKVTLSGSGKEQSMRGDITDVV